MSLTVGSSLGPYEITALLGAGGMGEVYRARDKRLDRVVAIKVLPSALSARPDLRQRLEREARTISSLNHPNICTLFDVGETPDGSAFLVMELLEGETLAERLARGPIPLRQTVRIGAEIAEALDRAHRQGIVHRDLKPANVMITKTGVKLLDFGLAKLITNSEGGVVSDPNSPTVQHERDVTAEGMIVGTLQYMSPEQLEGKVADARSDIFALGATLYEMIAGQRAFQANSRAAMIARILHDDPAPLASVTPPVPPQVIRLVDHCLMKEPDDRWQTARDVAIQLRGMTDASSTSEGVTGVLRHRRVSAKTVGASLLLLLGAAAAFLWLKTRRPTTGTESGFSHISVSISPDEKIALAHPGFLAVSPDGTTIVFFAGEPGKVPQLYLRRLDSFIVTPLAETDDASSAFFSPDGTELAFIARGEMKRLVLNGGTPEKIIEAGPAGGGSWGSDGMIVYNPIPTAALHKVPASGGTPVAVLKAGQGSGTETLPHYRPELGLLFFVSEIEGKSYEEAEISVMALGTGTIKTVARGTAPRYVAKTNTLLFARDGRIWSVAFDPEELRVRGTPAVIAQPVLNYRGTGDAMYDVTAAGDVVFAPYEPSRLNTRLFRVSRDGSRTPLPFPPELYQSPHLSRDGRLLMVEIIGANNDVWLGDVQRGTLNRLTSSWENLAPVLSPDGRQVIVSRHRGTMPALYVMRTDGVGEPRRIVSSEFPQFAFSWSDDGTTVAFVEITSMSFDISLLRMTDPVTVVPLIRTRFWETEPALSPDAKWIAYVSDETGKGEVYVRATEAEGTKLRISTDGGREPLFAHNGKDLFYRRGDTMMMVRLSFEPALTASEPVRLFDFPSSVRDINRGYDITPDDQAFVMIERAAAAENMRTIHVIRGAVK